MIRKILQYFLPFESNAHFPDEATKLQYQEWDQPSRFIQISAITFLTAMLYVVFTFLNKSWAPEHAQVLMAKIHLMLIVPMLLGISLLAYQKRHFRWVMRCLCVFPLISMSAHAYIASQFTNNTVFLTEGYLGVVWTFIISGLSFRYACISASLSSLVLVVAGYYFIQLTDAYTMHVFWLLCSFSFGFMGALIFDRSRKVVFFSQQELHRLAVTDELTGAYNRNKFHQLFDKEIARDQRYSSSFALLMVDIDHFKSINDNFGHEVGDQVLRKTAAILSAAIRENDTLVRWGGEEFVIIALEIDQHSLSRFCEKLRYQIEQQQDPQVGKITVSIGATLFNKSDTANSMLARADKALYQAKANGRNTVVTQLA